jgi:proton-coupled amino acid transporter
MSSANPNESSFSNIALEGATLEDKARVLRRHLVSAEERGGKSGSPGGHISGDVTPVGDHGDSGIAGGGNGGASAIESRDDDDGSGPSTSKAGGSGYGSTDNEETFPLPYDAPGGDVT